MKIQMKKKKRIAIILVIVAAAFYVYKAKKVARNASGVI